MKRQSRILSAFLALLMMVSLLPAAMAYGEIETSVAGEGDYDYESVVLFTQDIHDHFLPVPD